jgi:dTDP-4-dehydrorhamnose 3,5-epimerase
MSVQIHAGDIAGVVVRPLKVHVDKVDPGEEVLTPGHLMEVWRNDLEGFPPDIAQTTCTLANPGTVKSFHHHFVQHDIWFFLTGRAAIVLRDLRTGSNTYLATMVIECGEGDWKLVEIPPGVAHGYKVVSDDPAVLFYHTTEVYNPEDEGRYDPEDRRMHFDWANYRSWDQIL